MTVRLTADTVGKRFGGVRGTPVLEGLSLQVQAGELVVITGPSGSGKTTLLALLAGWVEPDAGWVRFAEPGGATSSPTGATWTEVAFVPQGLGLLADLDIEENVALPLRWAPTGDAARSVLEQLTRFGIEHLASRHPFETSLGEQQRAAVAHALVTQPLAVLADEPSAHQDRRWAGEVYTALRLAAEAGHTCVVASHDPAAAELADRVIRLGGPA